MNTIEAIRRRLPRLFSSRQGAWDHFAKHPLDYKDEWQSWAVLLSKVYAGVDAARCEEWQCLARNNTPARPPSELQLIWEGFLRILETALETGLELNWAWEEQMDGEEQCCILSPQGIFFFATENVVRTGFLPAKEGCFSTLNETTSRRYHLFRECRNKILKGRYQAARRENRLICETAELASLMQRVPSLSEWINLVGGCQT